MHVQEESPVEQAAKGAGDGGDAAAHQVRMVSGGMGRTCRSLVVVPAAAGDEKVVG